MSLNLLFHGFQPQKPLADYIKDAGDNPISADLVPDLSPKPIATHDGNIVHCILGGIKADWKFHKDTCTRKGV